MNATSTKTGKDHAYSEEFDSAKQSAREAYENFVEAREHLKSAARAAGIEMKETADDELDDVIKRVLDEKERVVRTSEEYVRENPLASAGIAFLAGFIISKLIGR